MNTFQNESFFTMLFLFLFPHSRYLFTMPCFSKNEESLTVKLVSLFPEQNPSIHSIIILLNSTTGAIEAVRKDLLRSAVCSYKTGIVLSSY